MDAIRGAREVSQRRPRGELNPPGGGALHMKFSRDAAISRIPAPHLLKQGQLQLAGASFRDMPPQSSASEAILAILLQLRTLVNVAWDGVELDLQWCCCWLRKASSLLLQRQSS